MNKLKTRFEKISAVKFVVMNYCSEGKYKCKNNKRGEKAMRFWNGKKM